jgi:signal transduction histidine kinase
VGLRGAARPASRKAARRSRQRLPRRQAEFLVNLSHELHTPLNAIIGFSEMLSHGMLGELNERQLEYVQDILSAGRHLLALVNDILDLARIDAGEMQLELAEFSMREVLEYAVGIVRPWSVQRGLTLGLEIETTVDAVKADERKIKQVLFNLLSNAMRVTPNGGTIHVRASLAADPSATLFVSVSDTGAGMTAEQQARIFDEFNEAVRTPDGSGLGLALARHCIELHGGRLWVESQPGQGSTFTFTIPLAISVATTQPQRAGAQAPAITA